jgi:hypothetical protein
VSFLLSAIALWIGNSWIFATWMGVNHPMADDPLFVRLILPFTDSEAASLLMLLVIPLSLTRGGRTRLAARSLTVIAVVLNAAVVPFWVDSLLHRVSRHISLAEWAIAVDMVNILYLLGVLFKGRRERLGHCGLDHDAEDAEDG